MKKILSWSIFTILLLQGLTLLYRVRATKIYEISSLVLFRRPSIVMPEYLGETGVNRWVWVRNGLATKEEVISDSLLRKIIDSEPVLKARLEKSASNQTAISKGGRENDLAELRRSISITFTGADVYSFGITIQDTDPDLAVRISESIIKNLIAIEIDIPIDVSKLAAKDLQTRSELLAAEIARMEKSPQGDHMTKRLLAKKIEDNQEIERALRRLDIANSLLESEKKMRYSLVIAPNPHGVPIWPRAELLHLAALIFGLFLSVGGAYLKILSSSHLKGITRSNSP